MKIVRVIWPLMMIVLSSGCAKSIFDQDARCPFAERGGCQSMEMVNKMVSERRFTRDGMFVQQACVDCSEPVNTNPSDIKDISQYK